MQGDIRNREKELKASTQMSTQCSQLSPHVVRETRREEVQEEKQKGQERRKVTEEGGVGRGSRQEHHMLQKAPGPGFAAVLASAVSVSDSWLGAGPYPRAACPAATPLPRAGSHPSPAHSTGRLPRLEQVIQTSMPPWRVYREKGSLSRQACPGTLAKPNYHARHKCVHHVPLSMALHVL